MLDGKMRTLLDPVLDRVGKALAAAGIGANAVTIAGFAIGLAAAAAIAYGMFLTGLVLILASRVADGLDGAVARASRKTDFGGFLDIVLDFGFYGAIPFAFIVLDPTANAIAGGLLLVSFYVNGASFLAYAVMAEKRALETSILGSKSLFFTTGLAEATETLAVFVGMCLFPQWFNAIAVLFAVVVFYTALSRIVLAARNFAG
ncbi:MAG: CDP-alcohol phosphatidyltransferase family protein [Nitratireductor sp.]|nr:CDP-alcohol phosphatidyltransferase family protein [Nitratireductor sp.]